MLRHKRSLSLGLLVLGILAAGVLAWGPPPRRAAHAEDLAVDQPVRDRILRDGQARVLVRLRVPSGRLTAEGALPSESLVAAQRSDIASSRSQVLARLQGTRHGVARAYQTVPLLALTIGADALAQLEASGQLVSRVMPDSLRAPVLTQSVPLVQGDQAWAAGYDGTGTTVAILDTGVDGTHPFLANKVVDQACFSSTVSLQSTSVCPDGQDEQIGAGAGVPCPLLSAGCWHGTHVAGIAAGNGDQAGQLFSGVAKGATIIAVQVFSRVDSAFLCGGSAPCMQAWVSDIIAALDHVYALRGQHNLASVNLSLGGGLFPSPCDTEPEKDIIDNLRSVGIATVIAAGNDGSVSGLTAPGCISTAVSVGATTKSDVVASFSNVASFLSVFAPGQSIQSSYAGGGWATASGTSMATPHVAGAFAVLRQAAPSATVDEMLAALQQTGTPITDTRAGGTVTRPRIRILDALLVLDPTGNPVPALDSLNPSSAAASGSALTLEVDGSNFVPASVVRWNGASRPTTFVSGGRLRAGISANDLATQGTAQVTVFTPQPGGGTSSSLAFTITPLAPGPPCPAKVIVDNLPPWLSSGKVSFTGAWSTAAQPNAFGANGALVSSGVGLDTYTWKTPVFTTAQACTYRVSVWWTAGKNRSASAPYTVSGQTGGAVTKTFDQRFGGGQWNLHGTYTFPAGAKGRVTLTDQNGKVAADAVRFVLVP